MTAKLATRKCAPVLSGLSEAPARAATRPLRIGIMLRAVEEVDGCGVFVRKLLAALFESDRTNHYVLLYMRRDQTGHYPARRNVTEVVLPVRNKILWDQVAVPLAAKRHRLDLLFHHKFTIPLISPCPTIVQQQGDEYWTYPQYYELVNRLYATNAIPLYCRRATRVLTISAALAESLSRFVGIPAASMGVIHAATDPIFTPIIDPDVIEHTRAKYNLPSEPFFLMVAKGYANLGTRKRTLYQGKNIAGTLQAYRDAKDRLPSLSPLVVAGPGITERLDDDMRAGEAQGIFTFPGYIAYADMPAVYAMARALVFPSFSESFGIPLVEAMGAGCPVITSTTGACPEVVGDAAITLDPNNVRGLAESLIRLETDPGLRASMRERGIARAREFSYEASARRLREEFEAVGHA